jgi:flagellar motor switch protein FliG
MTAQAPPNSAQLGDIERAAVILMLMDEEEAARLLAGLGPEELQRVGEKMLELGEIDAGRIAAAITAFVSHAQATTLSAHDRPSQVRSRMVRAVGEMKADSIMQRIAPQQAQARSLELARWLAPPVLLTLLEDEHPQAIAVLLLLIEAEPAAELLTLLPGDRQADVVERIARMRSVSAQAMGMLDTILSGRISGRFGSAALEMGGAREAAELINMAAGHVGRTVMPAITSRDADLARAIEAEMFTFEMLFDLEPMAMGRLLREIENEVLIDALKGLEEDARDPFFAAMSSRAADGVKDEIEMRGKLRREDVVAAQKSIIAKARELAEQGEISLGSDDGEFV